MNVKSIEEMVARIQGAPVEGEWLMLKDLVGRVLERVPAQGTLSDCQWRRLWRPVTERFYRMTRVEVAGRHGEFDLTPAVAEHVGRSLEAPYGARERARLIAVAVADVMWARSGNRVAPGAGHRPKREALLRRMLQMQRIGTPRALVLRSDAGPALFLEDGNNRFALLRDGGAEHVRVCFETGEDLRRALEVPGLVVEEAAEEKVTE